MTKQPTPHPERSFVALKLPWILAAAALVVYLLTFNHWISLNNLAPVARRSGWMWGPELSAPLFYVLTYPFRWLPTNLIPLAFNFFSVLCGAAAVGLLARAVALIPRNRTHDQRVREKGELPLLSGPLAWIPPVFAAVVCGLQLTVWEHSTTGSTDALDLLLVAYVVRNLLEYRVAENDSWLFRAALVCGLGMANNWPMFVLFPPFIAAVIWLKRLEFFNARFLVRMTLCGFGGMLLFLLLPTIHVLSQHPLLGFWGALKTNLTSDKQALMHFYGIGPGRKGALMIFWMATLLPLVVISIRWPSNFGDPSRMGGLITRWVFHVVHAALLLFFLWIALDPVFSPRRLGYPISAFTLLTSVTIGYMVGYFLLVSRPLPDRMGRVTPVQSALHKLTVGVVALLFLSVSVGMLTQNLPQVRMTNGPALRNYAERLTQDLAENALVLSDDSRKLYLAQAASGRGKRLFFDTQLATVPAYHAFQKKRYTNDWPSLVNPGGKDEVKPAALMGIVFRIAESRPLEYLHPSFGYYFEVFQPRPHGINLHMVRYPTNSLHGKPLSETEIATNEQFWAGLRPEFDRLIPFIAPPALVSEVSFGKALRDRLKLTFQPNATAVFLGSYYSQFENFWGVQQQRAGRLKEAQTHFRSAIDLFPDNLAATRNLAFNRELQAGRKPELRPLRSLEEELGRYRSWEQVLRDTGPFDEPTLCFALGMSFAQGGNYRQAAQLVERVYELIPRNLQVAFWLSRLYVINQMPDKATELLALLRSRSGELAELGIRRIDMLQAEAGALYVAQRTEEADRLVRQTLERNPDDLQTVATAMQLSSIFRSYTNALAAADYLLKLRPDDVQVLINKGVFNIQLGRFSDALAPLSRALSLQSTNYSAQLYRAIAYLNNNQLDEARKDYEQLAKVFPNSNDVNIGLAELALRRQDTNTAIRHLEMSLRNTPVDSPQARQLSNRINALRNPAPSQQ